MDKLRKGVVVDFTYAQIRLWRAMNEADAAIKAAKKPRDVHALGKAIQILEDALTEIRRHAMVGER